MAFRFDTKTLYLTYAQCSLPKEEVYSQLAELLYPNDFEQYIIAEERHKDGNFHVHAYLVLHSQFRSRNAKALDLTGLEGEKYHPHIQARVRSPTRCIAYCQKEGNYLTNMTFEPSTNPWTTMLEEARSGHIQQARLTIEQAKPRDSIIYSTQINTALLAALRSMAPITTALTTDHYEAIPDWNRALSLIIEGPSGLGKTSLAKLLLPKALFCSHVDTLKSFQIGVHEGIIFDDVTFSHLPRVTQIHICDTYDNRDIHCRHSNAFIPAHTPRIFTTNEKHYNVVKTDDEAIARRTTVWYMEKNVDKIEISKIY